MHQLFVNLLSSAIKFNKPESTPLIQIATEKIKNEETYDGIAFSDREFYKIVVSDNGIGFKQEFAE